MKDFKEIFEAMATEYVEYVTEKIEKQKNITNCGTDQETMILMDEVRTANAIASTLTRMNANTDQEHALYSAN